MADRLSDMSDEAFQNRMYLRMRVYQIAITFCMYKILLNNLMIFYDYYKMYSCPFSNAKKRRSNMSRFSNISSFLLSLLQLINLQKYPNSITITAVDFVMIISIGYSLVV